MSKEIALQQIRIKDPFWSGMQEKITDTVIPFQERVLNDKEEGVEKSHALDNFRIAAGLMEGEFYGMVFQDSDVAKWLEGVAYSLVIKPDAALEQRADDIIDIIAKAQQPDGYLNTFFTIKEPEHRWQNLLECHELYCAGHMMEAAVAYYEATGKDKLLGVMERALYNGIISGMQLDGKRFFYVNPLEVNPGVSGEIFGYKHVIPERPGWYACACCPPNLVRMVTSLGKYAWDEDETAVYSHLFLGQEAALGKADIRVESAYPWEGSVTYHVSAKIDELFTLAIHIPAYVKDLRVTVNGEAFDTAGEIRDGYLYISRKWGSDDQVELHFPLPVRKIYASTHVREDVGCVALMRGPVVYCFEGADNGANLQALAVKKELDAKALVCTEGKLSGLTLLDVAGIRLVPSEELYTEEPPKEEAVMLRAIPYFAWGNRGLNQMRVWMHEK